MNIIQAIEDRQRRFFANCFKDIRTWTNWLVFLRALFGLPIERGSAEHRLFTASTGRAILPERPFREAYAICGRRSGKSYITALVSVFLSCFQDWSRVLASGERGKVFVVAVDKAQAGIVFNYIRGILESSPNLRAAVENETSDGIMLRNHVDLSVRAQNFRSVRGYSAVACIVEELAYWRSEESAYPDREFIAAIRPSLALVPGSMLIGIGSPYGRFGFLYDQYRQHFGRDDDPDAPLIWKADSRTMNSTIPLRVIDRAMREDAAVARCDWGANFREDLEAFLSQELIESAVIPGRVEIPPASGIRFWGWCDPSGGRHDSMTLAIAHRDAQSGRVIVDALREVKSPLQPLEVVASFAEILRSYGCADVHGDSYGAEFCASAFRDVGIYYRPSEKSASELYLALLPALSNHSVELVDNPRLISQLRSLERRTRSGGRDLVTHYPGGLDDCAAAVAGVVHLAAKPYVRDAWQFSAPRRLESKEAQLDREARDWLLDKPPAKPREPHEQTDEEFIQEIEAEVRAELEAEAKLNDRSEGRTVHGW